MTTENIYVETAIDRGMQIQLQGLRKAMNNGTPRVGWKIGITDQASQQK